MSIDLKALGFTKEELQERVVARIAYSVMTDRVYDPESDDEYERHSQFRNDLQSRVKTRIDEKIDELAQKFVLPNVSEYIETLTLQETNQWGEKTGKPVTFIEYLTSRAEAYMQEKVNYEGKSKLENGPYSWSGTQTRITYLVNSHLHYSIEKAMKEALSIATNSIAKGINETVKIKLAEIASKMTTTVSTK